MLNSWIMWANTQGTPHSALSSSIKDTKLLCSSFSSGTTSEETRGTFSGSSVPAARAGGQSEAQEPLHCAAGASLKSLDSRSLSFPLYRL